MIKVAIQRISRSDIKKILKIVTTYFKNALVNKLRDLSQVF